MRFYHGGGGVIFYINVYACLRAAEISPRFLCRPPPRQYKKRRRTAEESRTTLKWADLFSPLISPRFLCRLTAFIKLL